MTPDTDLVNPLVMLGYRPLARLRPRHAREISASPWGIGCETLDRDYVSFAETLPHLGDLGAKRARLQGGWAKCEPKPGGPYEWAWLDAVVDGCVAQSVQPWIQLSYGHPGYAGGGGIGLAQGLPTSLEALSANERWAHALVSRYRGRVGQYEIWNEPDLFAAASPEAYTDYFIRLATQVRSADPDARVIGLALCHDTEYADRFLATLAARGRRDLLDELTYHLYPEMPEAAVEIGDKLAAACVRHGFPELPIHQGETGAPSDKVHVGALKDILWNERKQAAWNTRRLLAHHAAGRAMSLFQLADMYYNQGSGALFAGRNPKGLLCIRPDLTVAYRKPAYFAAQHVFTVFDGAYPLHRLATHPARSTVPLVAHAWQRHDDATPGLLAWWRADLAPQCMAPALTPVALNSLPLREPVLVDFLSGLVFSLPEVFAPAPAAWWANLPAADTPLAVAERSSLPLAGL
jgi:polysaccharide biosynthesis protein PslG